MSRTSVMLLKSFLTLVSFNLPKVILEPVLGFLRSISAEETKPLFSK